jgi:hypothetical protein
MQWSECFPTGSRVLALPSWDSPRLYFSEHGPARRWTDSAVYPAFKFLARGYKLMLRAKAAAGLLQARVSESEWALGDFVKDLLPPIASVAVLVGTPGPAQKTTIQFRDESGRVTGYLKCGHTPMSCHKLANEHTILTHLPPDAGSKVLKFGPLRGGQALLTAPIEGTALSPTLPPPQDIQTFFDLLKRSGELSLDNHPWIRHFSTAAPAIEPWLQPLRPRSWPIVFQHGDLAPWNLIRETGRNNLRAIDWEEGLLDGFPLIDLAYYNLQTAELIHRWPARKAVNYAIGSIQTHTAPTLDADAALSIVRLSARWAYHIAEQIGIPADNRLQQSRRTVWEVQP